jgi:hypothetical protein
MGQTTSRALRTAPRLFTEADLSLSLAALVGPATCCHLPPELLRIIAAYAMPARAVVALVEVEALRTSRTPWYSTQLVRFEPHTGDWLELTAPEYHWRTSSPSIACYDGRLFVTSCIVETYRTSLYSLPSNPVRRGDGVLLHPDAPDDSPGCVLVGCGGHLYATGGFLRDSRKALNTMHCFDVRANKWITARKKPMLMPRPRYAHTATAIDDRYFILAGGAQDHFRLLASELDRYDTVTKQWDVIASTRHNRQLHTATTVGQPPHALVLCGGIDDRNGQDTIDSVELLDLRTFEWSALPPSPQIHYRGLLCSPDANTLLRIGGQAPHPLADLERYDFDSKRWAVELSRMPGPCADRVMIAGVFVQ